MTIERLLLAGLVAILLTIIVRPGRAGPRERRAKLWRLMRAQVLRFAVPAIVVIALLGRWDALWAVPGEFLPVAHWLGSGGAFSTEAAVIFIAGPAVGMAAHAALLLWRTRGGRAPGRLWTLGDYGTLIARDRGEVPLGIALSATAGVCEELIFRLALPLLLAAEIGALPAFAVSAILFGACHRYQGWAGVVGTTLVGVMLTGVYLLSGSLIVAMAVHALINVNGLVLLPALRRWCSVTASGGSPS